MGACCSDVSAVPDHILPDPIPDKGYKVTLKKLSSMVGDTYEIYLDGDKWLNIRRYKDGGKAEYKLENYVREEGKDEGQRLAFARGENFHGDMYSYKKPEQESSDSGDEGYSDSPDDAGEWTVHKAKWSVKNEVIVCDAAQNEIGRLKVKAKGKVIRTSTIREHQNAEGQCHKSWSKEYDSKVKKVKYTIELAGHEPVSFKLKGSISKREPLEWGCEAFVASAKDSSSSEVQTFDGHDPNSGFMMAFICTQVLCPGDIHEGCVPRGHDDLFPHLDDPN